MGGVGAKRLGSLPGAGALWPGGKNVTVCGSLVSSQLQRTFWPTDTVALAGMNCSTAIWVWSGSLMPARIVMGSAVTTPDDFDFDALLELSDDPQAVPRARTPTVTAANPTRTRRVLRTPIETSAWSRHVRRAR